MSTERNILFLQSSSEGYGSSKILIQVLQVYQALGFRPTVVLTIKGELEESLNLLHIPYHIKNLGILRRKYFHPLGGINRFTRLVRSYFFLSRLHKTHSFEAVYSNTLAVVIGAIWAKRHGLPHLWHIHEILEKPPLLVKGLSRLVDWSTPYPIAVSHAVAKQWQPLLRKSTIEVIHNGIPYQAYKKARPTLKKELGLSEDTLLVGMVGRINPGKGQIFFLEMAQKLSLTLPSAHFVLVGDPFADYDPLLDEIKAQINSLGIEQRVSYLGFRKDIPEVMASLDVFVLPSIAPDSFPTVLLEAMASKKPVVATRSGGASELVEEGHTGFLIPIGAVEEGVMAIEKLLTKPSLRTSFGQAGQDRVLKHFSLKTFEEKLRNHAWQHLKKN
ncbi:MAG: glycosyltransferase family 4 protein [Algoriphagus sp.]